MLSKLFLASSNPGKLQEFRTLANQPSPQNSPLDLSLLPNFSTLPAFDESAPSFGENAAGKALHYSQFTTSPILADDSGLVVPALNNAPGVRSARYAGPNATSSQRNEKLLQEMRHLRGDDRRAHFICVLAVARQGYAIAIISARADGQITAAPSGTAGFGYDPIFHIPALNKTFAELSPDQKNLLSHRGKAFDRLRYVLAGL